MNTIGPKEELSQFTEEIFKRFVKPGLHVCDLATGGGKSYTIGKLVSQYYTDYFERIVLISVQKKLDDSLNREIDRFIKSKDSLIEPSDKLIVEKNTDVLLKGIRDGAFDNLIRESQIVIERLKSKGNFHTELTSKWEKISDRYKEIKIFVKSKEDKDFTSSDLYEQLLTYEKELRKSITSFLMLYIEYLKGSQNYKEVSIEVLTDLFPSLLKCYPQINWKERKVLTMTIHKAMYGINTIISKRIGLQDFVESGKKTLIIFDESDQVSGIMGSILIEQSIERNGGASSKSDDSNDLRYMNGYDGMKEYNNTILKQDPEELSEEYGNLAECIKEANQLKYRNWAKIWNKDIPMYNDIRLSKEETIGQYRKGIFFSGSAVRMNISFKGDKTRSYVCYEKGKCSFTLVHANDESVLASKYELYVTLEQFLWKVLQITKGIKSKFGRLIFDTYSENLKKYYENIKRLADDSDSSIERYVDLPSLENEIQTFFSRFGTTAKEYFIRQMIEYMTRRKSLALNRDSKKIKVPDYSVYSQGVQLFIESPDPLDRLHRVRMSHRDITTTPESIIIDLLSNPNTSIVLCSATASNQSVVSNFDLTYLKHVLGERMSYIKKEDLLKFDSLVERTLPANHNIRIVPIDKTYLPEQENKMELPERYLNMFSPQAIEEGLPEKWFDLTKSRLAGTHKIKDVAFQMERLLQFIEVYHWFHTHKDVRSMLFFQNRTGSKDQQQYQVLSSLIDGSYKTMSPFRREIPTDWENPNIYISKDLEEIEREVLTKLSSDKDARVMLITAYGSFKAGANLQYPIPKGLKVVSGDNWKTSGDRMNKDWDAVYLQFPTAYLRMELDGTEWEYEKSLYKVMLKLMQLRERGYLSDGQVGYWVYQALIKDFKFGDNSNGGGGIRKDKAAWALTVLEQAIGRLCRTRNKPQTTYILYETLIEPYFKFLDMEKSLTKEFKSLAQSINSHNEEGPDMVNIETVIRNNKAQQVRKNLRDIRRKALFYGVHPYEQPVLDDEDQDEENVYYTVTAHQQLLQEFKRAILRYPTVSDFGVFDEHDRLVNFLPQCYGDYSRDIEGINLPTPASTRLDVMMKNPVIRSYFEKNGYATEWSNLKLMLHPDILAFDYAGEIGEEAFKALVLHYTDCKEENILHLEGKDYELGDFVIVDNEGNHRIAFDVKNMAPDFEHSDKPGDIPTSEKREIKRKRLNCELITVNILQINQSLIGDLTEIPGIIDTEGKIIPSAILRLQAYINSAIR